MQITDNGSIIHAKRFRVDAAIIFFLGIFLTTSLTILLLNRTIGAVVFIIPALLSFSMAGFSFTILRKNRFEELSIDTKNKTLQIGHRESIPYANLKKITLTGSIYKSLVLEIEDEEIIIFTGFIILKKFLYLASILNKEKIAVSETLLGLISPNKNRMSWKIIIAMLSIWVIITLISQILRNQ